MYLEGTYNDSLNKAYNLLNQGNVEQSIKLFEKITASYPNTAKGFHLKAYAYIKAGKNNFAYDNFTKAHSLDPDSVDITMDFASFLSQIGKTDKALDLLKSLEGVKDNPKLLYNMGCILMDAFRYNEALENFKKNLEIEPLNEDSSFNVGICLYNLNKYKLAIKVFEEYQKSFGINFEAERYISISCFSINELDNAEKSIKKLLKLKPNDASIFFELGLVLSKNNKFEKAIDAYSNALELQPDFSDAFKNMALLMKKTNKLDDAISFCKQKLSDNKNDYIALSNIAQLYQLNGEADTAIFYIDKAIKFYPHSKKDKQFLNYKIIRGNLLGVIKKYEESIECYKEVIEINPKIEQAYTNIGTALNYLGKEKEAIPYLKKAVDINPRFATGYLNLGNTYFKIGENDKAMEYFAQAEKLDPTIRSHTLSSKAAALIESGKPLEAIVPLTKSIQDDPMNGSAYLNLGVVFRDLSKFEEAAKWLKRGIVIIKSQPYKENLLASCYANLGYTYLDLAKWEEMKECFEKVVYYNDKHISSWGFLYYAKLFIAEWKDLKSVKDKTLELINKNINVSSPFTSFSVSDDPKVQYIVAKNYSEEKYKIKINGSYTYSKNITHNKPRVAYLSADFHDHATMHLLAGVFENQSSEKFDYYAFSYSKSPDDTEISKRIKKCFKKFEYVAKKSDQEIENILAKEEIDIAVDLKGYTYGTRMNILSSRPCPIQISYLGHPGTTATEFIDYTILDDYVVTENNKEYFSEKILKLPGCYQPNDDKRYLPKMANRKEYNLPENKFIFCSFNNTYKIQPKMFGTWMEILKEKPDSCLWLLDTHKKAKSNLYQHAKDLGVEQDRIIFCDRLVNNEHLKRQMCADLFLDTFPINAHTTASDALWVGLPILTLSGESMVSRVAGSILKNIGMEQLITSNYKDYKALALELANNAKKLDKIKNEIKKNRFISPLFNTKKYTLDLEDIYINLFNNFVKSKKSI